MTPNQFALLELTEVPRTADSVQMMRLMLSAMPQALVDAELTAHIDYDLYEGTPAGGAEPPRARKRPHRSCLHLDTPRRSGACVPGPCSRSQAPAGSRPAPFPPVEPPGYGMKCALSRCSSPS
jgi:hypothetical protein